MIMVQKTMFVIRREIFSFKDLDGSIRHFDITALRAFSGDPSIEKMRMPIQADHARTLKEVGTVEERFLAKISKARLKDRLYVCEMDGEHGEKEMLLVDGNHRYYQAYQLGYKWMDVLVFPETIWKNCLIADPGIHFESLGLKEQK
jgi:hypothetical protein